MHKTFAIIHETVMRHCLSIRALRKILLPNYLAWRFAVFCKPLKLGVASNCLILVVRSRTNSVVILWHFGRPGVIVITLGFPMIYLAI